MNTFLVVLLVALALLIVAMAALRLFLYYTIVVPHLTNTDYRFWVRTLIGDAQSRYTRLYMAGLPDEQHSQWPNWYLTYGGYLIGAVAVVWCLILFAAR